MALTAAELEARRSGIGGGDIAGIMGLSPYVTPLGVYRLKRGTGVIEETQAMYWGTALQSSVIERYWRDHGQLLVSEMECLIRHKSLPWVIGHPDALVCNKDGAGSYGLEVKTSHAFAAEQWKEGVPEHYQMQCQWYMLLMEYDRWDVAVLIGGQDYREYVLARDEELIQKMLDAARHFWFEHVQEGIPPEPIAQDNIADEHPADRAPIKSANYEEETVVLRYRDARDELVQAQALHDALKTRLQMILGDAAGIEGPWGRITWKANARGARVWRPKFTAQE